MRENERSIKLEHVNNICKHLDSIMDLDELYSKVVEVIHNILNYEHVALYLIDFKNSKIALKSFYGIYKGAIPDDQRLEMNQGIVGYVVNNGKTLLSNNVKKSSHFYNITPDITPTKSEMCVPIKVEGKIIGVLNIESTKIMDFSKDDLNSLEVLANRIGVAINNSKLYNRLERNTQRLYDIVSSMHYGIILINRHYKIEWANKTWEEWLLNKNIVNKYCYEAFKKDKCCSECPLEKVFKTGKIYRHTIITKDKKHYSVTSAPIKDDEGSVKQIIEVFEDITENVNLKKKMNKTKERLEKFKDLAVIGETVSSIAHEIKNPLNAISTAIDVLQSDLKVCGDNKKLLDIVREESKRLNSLIYNYLKYTNKPGLKLSLNDIRDTIEEVVMLVKVDKNVNENIDIITHFDNDVPKLKYDKDSIKRVFWNLIINSVQSIKNQGTIEINIGQKNCYVTINVKDNGSGISAEKMDNIFKQFYSSKEKGIGLGLTIVKKIIDQHKWDVSVESKLQKGTTFTINAPINN